MSAGNFNNSLKRIHTIFQRLSLAPCEFFLFPKMKIKLKGVRLGIAEENEVETQIVLNTLTKKQFHGAFQKWQKHGVMCVHSQGGSCESDGAEYHAGKM
jgi:hypothetical protein